MDEREWMCQMLCRNVFLLGFILVRVVIGVDSIALNCFGGLARAAYKTVD